jgi:pimeloyl-ACP methyl ester carboxylesterase
MPSSYLFINGLRVHYLHWNLRESGRRVLLLHGLGSNARAWERLAPVLSGKGLAPLAPDLRGHGLTDRPDGDYGLPLFVRDLAALIEAAGLEGPVLCGHAWGGLLALEYAAQHAFGPLAPAAVVLVEGGLIQLAGAAETDWERARPLLDPPRWDGLPLPELLKVLARPGQRWQPDEEAIGMLLANVEIGEDELAFSRLSRAHQAQLVQAMRAHPTYERFERIRCPVLAVLAKPGLPRTPGEEAYLQLKQQSLAVAQEKIQAFRFHWIPGSVHDLPLQRPGELGELIAGFITSLQA